MSKPSLLLAAFVVSLGASAANAAPATEAELTQIAQQHAESETRRRMQLVTTVDYLDQSGTPRTRGYVWGPHGLEALDPRQVADPRYQAQFFTVEVGLQAATPPIVGFGRGLPLAIQGEVAASGSARRRLRSDRVVRTHVYGYGLRPVLAYESGRDRVFVDVVSGGTSLEPPVTRSIARRLVEREVRFAPAWRRVLTVVREGGR